MSPPPVTFDQLIVQQRSFLDQVVNDLALRHCLAASETREFRQRVDRAVARHDYEVLRNFDGRSTWETFLATVVFKQFFLYQAELWGLWRPSVRALQLGPEATLLEEMVLRDRLSLAAAMELMKTRHHVDWCEGRIRELAGQLRLDERHHEVLPPGVAGRTSDRRMAVALTAAFGALSLDDRLLLHLSYGDRQPLAQIARMLRTAVRPLARRLDEAVAAVRASLQAQGIPPSDIDLLLAAGTDPAPEQQRWWNSVAAGPSN